VCAVQFNEVEAQAVGAPRGIGKGVMDTGETSFV
jgi:hypothetical protein